MSVPRVSVIIAVYKPDRAYLLEAVRSVLSQSFAQFELILVEDPPFTDGLLEACEDARIRLLRQDQPGRLGKALNAGLRAARADLVARLDADDIATPERLERQVAYLEAHPECGVYGSRIAVIDASGRRIGRRQYPLSNEGIVSALRRYNAISHPAVMFRKDIVLAAGGYDETTAAEDYDLWCRLANSGVGFANAAEELTLYRYHAGASKFRAVHDDIRTTIAIKKRHFRGQLTLKDRVRLFAERALLLLPPRIVLALFRRVVYRAS